MTEILAGSEPGLSLSNRFTNTAQCTPSLSPDVPLYTKLTTRYERVGKSAFVNANNQGGNQYFLEGRSYKKFFFRIIQKEKLVDLINLLFLLLQLKLTSY